MSYTNDLDVKYDPDIEPVPAPFGLSEEEKIQITGEVYDACKQAYDRCFYRGRKISSMRGDVSAEAYIFMSQIMKAFNKSECGLMTKKGRAIKKKHPISYYFLGYFRDRCQLLAVNSLDKNNRRRNAVEKFMPDPEEINLTEASKFTDTSVTNTFEADVEMRRLYESLPKGADVFFVDVYENEMNRTALKKKYGKMYGPYMKMLRRRARSLIEKNEE